MNNEKKEKKLENIKKIFIRINPFLLKWLYLFFFVSALVYSYLVWDQYVTNSDWSEEKKQQYIKEKSFFSFENKNYQQALNLIEQKKSNLEKKQKFTGRDIFNPEGF